MKNIVLFAGLLMATSLIAAGEKEIANHHVEKKDNLFRISLMYNSTVDDIMKANPNIDNPKHIHSGMTVKVPKNTKMRDPAFVASFLNGKSEVSDERAAVEEKIEKPAPVKIKAPVQATAHAHATSPSHIKSEVPSSGIVVQDRSQSATSATEPAQAAAPAHIKAQAPLSHTAVAEKIEKVPLRQAAPIKDLEPMQAMTYEQAKAQIRAQRGQGGQPAEEKISKSQPQIVKETTQPEIIKETTPEELRAEQIATYERTIAREAAAGKSSQNTSYVPVRITSTAQIKDEAVQSKIETPVHASTPVQKEEVKIEIPIETKTETPVQITTPVEVKHETPIESKPVNTEAVQPAHAASAPAHIEDENPFLTPSEPAAKEDHSIEYQLTDPSSVKASESEDENPFAVPARHKEEVKSKPAVKSNSSSTITSRNDN